jgi:23S rRNA (cytosine1962-C5)-methyltransferase
VLVYLKAGKEKSLQRRHPWVYSTAIGKTAGTPQSGDTVEVRAADGKFLAWGAFSPESQIRIRAWSFVEADVIDNAWIAHKIRVAALRREVLNEQTDAQRLVFGEADQLPGLIVDRYGDWAVVQILSAAIEYWRAAVLEAVGTLPGIRHVYERSDAATRQREGLPPVAGPVTKFHQEQDVHVVPVVENGVHYRVDIAKGHKTGFYVDQRDNRALVGALAKGKRVLNCFCYTGGFSLAALVNGASEVISIDSSGDALARGALNQSVNSAIAQDARSEWRDENVFDALKQLLADGELFDIVILDPPKFAPSVAHLDKAARAYKEIAMKGLKLLKPNGYLLTFSCSGAMSVELFQKVIAGAVVDSRIDMQMLRRLEAGIDHPMLMTHPEGEYLKGLLLQRVG